MKSEFETIEKFLDALIVDSIKDVRYAGRVTGNLYCICGQPIKYAYKFINTKNNKVCYVGKTCLKYIADYLQWNN